MRSTGCHFLYNLLSSVQFDDHCTPSASAKRSKMIVKSSPSNSLHPLRSSVTIKALACLSAITIPFLIGTNGLQYTRLFGLTEL